MCSSDLLPLAAPKARGCRLAGEHRVLATFTSKGGWGESEGHCSSLHFSRSATPSTMLYLSSPAAPHGSGLGILFPLTTAALLAQTPKLDDASFFVVWMVALLAPFGVQVLIQRPAPGAHISTARRTQPHQAPAHQTTQ